MKEINNNKIIFEEALNQEILRNEKNRAILLGIASMFLFIALTVITIIYYHKIKNAFNDNVTGLFIVMGMFVLLAVREFNVRLFFNRRLKNKKSVHPAFRYLNAFIEVSLPTIMMLIVSLSQESLVILFSPATYLYFIFIILSILSLDFKLSLFTGAMASIEFIFLVIYLLNSVGIGQPELVYSEMYFYIGKGVILLLSGALAGFAADQLRKRILNSYRELNERNKIINLFGQQVSKEIVDELLSEEESTKSKKKFVCIMFLDIRGFTPFAEKRKPEEIIKYQNNVFGFMIDIITKNHGIINQFLGDGYMATFGAPVSAGNDCQNAVNAAREIINTLNQKNEDGIISNTRIGIGLHAGDVVAGNVGTTIRKQYSITGNPVILASRIEQLNKKYNSQLLISEEVLSLINCENLNNEFIGPVEVKGREKPINIYKLA